MNGSLYIFNVTLKQYHQKGYKGTSLNNKLIENKVYVSGMSLNMEMINR